jgi:lipopolysaccharide biosynthesis protein
VLIAQAHSPSDDIAFISYVARYLRDPRYIRIHGRPLLIVYRPDLFSDMKETADRWRSWCRHQGIGELFLAFTQSFETTSPLEYGLDAAIEFPPNNSGAPDITKDVELVDGEFSGVVYDWRIFPKRSRAYADPVYPLFRGVNPGWDNDARRPGRGAIFYGSSPIGYRQWLENAIEDTLRRFHKPDERLVFINAWNEWAEGAHLEPDQRYGYAYLQATRDAILASTYPFRPHVRTANNETHLT